MRGVFLALLLLFIVNLSNAMVSLPMKHTHLPMDHPMINHFLERRGVAAVSQANFPMGGNIYPVGIYWVPVDIGTPGQSLLVAVDSGSSDLVVPSSSCVGCHLQNTGSFNTSQSSTLSTVPCRNTQGIRCNFLCSGQCTFRNSYQTCNLTAPQQTCTVSGGLYSDIYSQGDFSAEVVFGLIEDQTLNFQQFFVIDGVIGMAFSAGSSWGGTVPFEALVEKGEVDNVFAMCMKPNAGGVLTLGGIDSNLYTGTFQYTPLLKYFGEYILYTIDVTDIQVAGNTIGLPASDYRTYGTMGGCVLDSGTNTILLPSEIYSPWEKTFNYYFQNQCKQGNGPPGVCDGSLLDGQCFQYSQQEREQFPEIELKLNDVTLVMSGPDYIVANSTATSNAFYCMGVLNTGRGGNFIVGDVLMQNYYVLFDRTNKRIGWAPVQIDNCVGLDEPIYY